jgi:uncharacterized protein YbjT (DUF2867 family)
MSNQIEEIHAVMGITGRVGGATARALLKAGKKVRGIVRDRAKAQEWEAAGVELVVADWQDTVALTEAFRGARGVFAMVPPNFTPSPGFPETRAVVASIREALETALPEKVVYLSSVGGQHRAGTGLILQCNLLEEGTKEVPVASAYLRAGWFMENFEWDVAAAREKGEIDAYLSPLDRRFPMIATEDIGRLVAETLQQEWSGNRVLELEGPQRYSQEDVAGTFARILERPVKAKEVPREEWAARFEGQGMPADRTEPRIEMLDGFNSGWIEFERDGTEHVTGGTSLEEVLRKLVN